MVHFILGFFFFFPLPLTLTVWVFFNRPASTIPCISINTLSMFLLSLAEHSNHLHFHFSAKLAPSSSETKRSASKSDLFPISSSGGDGSFKDRII